ncbi:MAG: type II secretion system F family protein [Alphaproteobacteria bacterium]|nr:type II secretion system F family protein [Alphaproteobacteria bacterium]
MDLGDILQDPRMIAGIMLAGAVFATVMSIAAPLFDNNQLEKRMKAVTEQRNELRRRSRKEIDKNSSLRRDSQSPLRDFVDRLQLQKLLADDTLQEKMLQAGLRGPAPISTFYFFRGMLPIALGVIALITVVTMGEAWSLQFTHGLAIVFVAIAIGFYAPTIYLSNKIANRRQSIMRAFPDALDMLLICVESGMSIELAFGRVGQEIGTASIELAEEMSLCTAELSYLPERRLAYENLARRTDHPGVKAVAMALVQAERYGTPLGAALRVMSKENRELRMTEAEKKAAALPAQLTVPMIAFFLPVLCAIIIGPAMIQVSAQLAGGR